MTSTPVGPETQAAASRRRRATAVATCLVVLACLIGFCLPASASAASRGFHIYNLSGNPLRLLGVSTHQFDGRPADGTPLLPGAGYQDFELKSLVPFESNTAYVSYTDPSHPDYAHVVVQVKIYLDDRGGVYSECSYMAPGVQCSAGGTDIAILDPPGTVHAVPPTQGQAQAATLKQFCDTPGTAASCKFSATSEAKIDSPSHQVGNALINNSDDEHGTTIEVEDKVGTSDSVGVELKFGGELFHIVEAEVTGKYDHEWTSEHSFKQTVDVHCAAHHKCWIDAISPLLRDSGDFTVKLGNTTWNLPDVYFDTPDPNGNGAFEVNEQPLSKSERKGLPPGFYHEPKGGPTPRYRVPRSPEQRGIVWPRLHLSMVGPSRLRPGAIGSYRITLSRTQPRHRVVYSLSDVRVVGRWRAHRARRWLIRTLPTAQPRTLRLRLWVPRHRPRYVCVTVNAAARHARAAHLRSCSPVGRPFRGRG